MPVVRQRKNGDCGVAALANLAEISYEDAYVAVARVDPRLRGGSGLHNHQVVKAAALLGIRLAPARKYDLDADEGILRVRWNGRRGADNPGGHYVTVKGGQVICPTDGFPTPWEDYLERWDARLGTLLRWER